MMNNNNNNSQQMLHSGHNSSHNTLHYKFGNKYKSESQKMLEMHVNLVNRRVCGNGGAFGGMLGRFVSLPHIGVSKVKDSRDKN
jgi:hypothetical protein